MKRDYDSSQYHFQYPENIVQLMIIVREKIQESEGSEVCVLIMP